MQVRDGNDVERNSLDTVEDRERKTVNEHSPRARGDRLTAQRMSDD
jgi:hypothetical protein